MIGVRAVLACTCFASMLLAACGQSANTPAAAAPPAPAMTAKADVIVTLDGAKHDCVVALSSEAQGSMISCDAVVAFVRDELRVPSGSKYDLRSVSNVDAVEKTKVEAGLKGAGYHDAKSLE